MKFAMISQPMAGKTREEILQNRDRAKEQLHRIGYEAVDSYFDEYSNKDLISPDVINKPLYFLAKSLSKMSECEMIYLCDGWDDSRGCRIEREVALAYGLKIMYQDVMEGHNNER